MKKFFYYALAAYMALVPFSLAMFAIIYLSYTDMSNATWAASSFAIFSVYMIYFIWMFED